MEMDENIKLQPEDEVKEFRYFPFKELPSVTTQVVDELIKCEIVNISIQHATFNDERRDRVSEQNIVCMVKLINLFTVGRKWWRTTVS